jgi:hypothetical protein
MDDVAFGFIQGLRGVLETPRGDLRWEVQAAQNVAQVFLAVNLKCATCHDSFIDSWKMTDVWGLAGVYAAEPLEVIRCESPQGVRPAPAFVFPEVGRIDPSLPTMGRRRELARLVTSPNNGRVARTVVNRLWRQLMGRGIIDPTDDLDGAAPFDVDVLDYLAGELVDHGYDLRHVIEVIVTSRAYQLSAVTQRVTDRADQPFRGPLVRRMTAEQFVDSLGALQGRAGRAWSRKGGRLLEGLGRPDRRTVATSRDERASTMQALELLNGPAVYEEIYLDAKAPEARPTDDAKARKKEAAPLRANPRLAELAKVPPRELVARLYTHGLGRPPTGEEMKLYEEILGERATPEAVGDVLWIVAMLPEFQLIR